MDNLFFFASKLLWLLLSPSSVLVIWILVTAILVHLKWQKWALRSVWSLSIVVVLIGFLPIGQWMLIPLERRFEVNPSLPDKVDGIVVLSGSELAKSTHYWQQVQLNGAAERNIAFMHLAQRYSNAKLVFTGGNGRMFDHQFKEADVAKKLYQQLGFDVSRINFERKARNTAENAALSYAMVKPQADENWVLITSAWHMPRSIGIFCQLGWSMTPYPVDYFTSTIGIRSFRWGFVQKFSQFNMASKEWIGLLVYHLTGRTAQLLPQSC